MGRPMPDLSVEAAARHLFLSINRFRQLQREGVLPRATSGDWTLDTIRRRYIENLRLAKGNHLPPGSSASTERLDLDVERARLAKEQADRTAMENERLRGKLVDVEAVKRLIERLVGAANARLGAIPAKLAPVVRPDNPVEARRLLELAVEEVRAELRRLGVEDVADYTA